MASRFAWYQTSPVMGLDGLKAARRGLLPLLGAGAALCLLLFGLFLVPPRSLSALYTHDVFFYFDAMQRIGQGQVPSVDFSTPLGGLALYLPYLTYRFLDSFAGSVELASFLLTVVALAVGSLLLQRRVPLLVGILVLAGLAGLVMVPVNLGEVGGNVSAAMYYNRWGWAGLALLFLLGLAPKDTARSAIVFDTAVVGGLLVFLFFLKATYFVVALGFVILFGLVFRLFVGPALIGLAIWLVVTLGVELASGMVSANLGDLHLAIRSSNTVRPHIATNLLSNAAHYGMLLLAYFYAAKAVRLTISQIAFGAFVAGSGTLLLNQNFQAVGIFTLVVLFAQLSALVQQARRIRPAPTRGLDLPLYLPPFLLLAFLAPQVVQWGVATHDFRTLTQCRECQAGLPRLEGFFVGERFIKAFDYDAETVGPIDLPGGDPQEPKLMISQLAYVVTLRSGVALLEAEATEAGPTLTFDFTSPFNFLLNLPVPSGDYLWVDYGRNVDLGTALPGRKVLRDVAYVMVPKYPANRNSRDFMLRAYGEELDRSFGFLAENEHWRLFRRRSLEPRKPT